MENREGNMRLLLAQAITKKLWFEGLITSDEKKKIEALNALKFI